MSNTATAIVSAPPVVTVPAPVALAAEPPPEFLPPTWHKQIAPNTGACSTPRTGRLKRAMRFVYVRRDHANPAFAAWEAEQAAAAAKLAAEAAAAGVKL